MKAVIQRVRNASVSVEGKTVGQCDKGYMILFCAVEDDTEEDLTVLAKKIAHLRIFEDDFGKMNRSILDIGGEVLAISQFTLCADMKKGNRPSFIKAMNPQTASEMYDRFCLCLIEQGIKHVDKGIFGADMQVSLVNDGPVTISMDTRDWCKHGD
ncbi:MAG: D-tyrosyl-tRNA(Tyr) deacylase [Clostridia bacterium]|nr:D-tyrosyl-tRNA(Tyr) deacylase [Clostridia bacterium]